MLPTNKAFVSRIIVVISDFIPTRSILEAKVKWSTLCRTEEAIQISDAVIILIKIIIVGFFLFTFDVTPTTTGVINIYSLRHNISQ